MPPGGGLALLLRNVVARDRHPQPEPHVLDLLLLGGFLLGLEPLSDGLEEACAGAGGGALLLDLTVAVQQSLLDDERRQHLPPRSCVRRRCARRRECAGRCSASLPRCEVRKRLHVLQRRTKRLGIEDCRGLAIGIAGDWRQERSLVIRTEDSGSACFVCFRRRSPLHSPKSLALTCSAKSCIVKCSIHARSTPVLVCQIAQSRRHVFHRSWLLWVIILVHFLARDVT
mmetsp:Transcript_474/g.993  ORF Transcript_474/g.993 Transcript_474/m.993 type:complete len:228 (+) Transcript_474:485-1168(+)